MDIRWGHETRSGRSDAGPGERSALLALPRIPADDDHGHGGLADDALRHAAKEQPADRSATVAPDNDHVGPLGRGGFEDRFARLAFPDEELDPDAYAATSLYEFLGGGLAVLADLVDAGEESAARQSKRSRIDDAHDEKFGLKSARDRECFVGCRQGRP